MLLLWGGEIMGHLPTRQEDAVGTALWEFLPSNPAFRITPLHCRDRGGVSEVLLDGSSQSLSSSVEEGAFTTHFLNGLSPRLW